jgi:DNA polymerase-4
MILHVDMDAFFAAVEQLADPRLRGKPVLVCGSPEGRSVVAAASYEARPAGVRAGMPVARARRLCPQAILVPGDPAKYVSLSLSLLELFKRYSPQVEPFSIDEAFLDVTNSLSGWVSPEDMAREAKRRIRSRVGLSSSIGIGPNKLVAKMASSLEKPDGLTRVEEGNFAAVFGQKPVTVLWGVGDKTAASLERMGIRSVSDLAAHPVTSLVRAYGVEGEYLHHAANGRDDTPVIPYYDGLDAKSVGHEHTMSRDVVDGNSLEAVILRLSDQVARRLRAHHYLGRTVTLKIRYADFRTLTRQRVLKVLTDEERTLYGTAVRLFREHWTGAPVRLLGVSLSGLVRLGEKPQSLLFAEDRNHRVLLDTLDRVRDAFGDDALTRARLVGGP